MADLWRRWRKEDGYPYKVIAVVPVSPSALLIEDGIAPSASRVKAVLKRRFGFRPCDEELLEVAVECVRAAVGDEGYPISKPHDVGNDTDTAAVGEKP